MDLSAALTDLHTLTGSLNVDDDTTTEALTALTENLKRAVPSFIGLQLVLIQHGHPVTLTAFDPDVQPGDVTTSLRLPLSLLGVTAGDQASAVTFYAGSPGAFVDLAADLSYALQLTDPAGRNSQYTSEVTGATVILDDPIHPTTVISGLDGVAELSTIRRAIGMLIGDGHLPDDAHTELARRAASAGVTILDCATELVRPRHHQPPIRPAVRQPGPTVPSGEGTELVPTDVQANVRLDQRFMAAVTAALDADGDPAEVLPAVLARACVQVLPVAGAGISWTDELRIPLGASDPIAVRAERLQTTLGEGPCLTASSTATPLRATGAVMAQRWPVFHQELLRQTPYRTIASFPLRSQQNQPFGALDLYSAKDNAFSDLILDQIRWEVADPIAAILFDEPPTIDRLSEDPPAWLASDAVTDRMSVWVAIGMIMENGVLTNDEALSVLRGYAFTHNTTLDELAAQVTTRQLDPDTVLNV